MAAAAFAGTAARSKQMFSALVTVLALAVVASAGQSTATAAPLDEMSLERWADLREAERYQLNIAEKYYREANWKVALSEYEKFLSLYEQSSGAPYAQLKWSLCQVNLRKVNTAIKEGYQSVIDYWPSSPEAIASAYLIGQAYKTMGETKQAKKAYAQVLAKHPKHLVATLARVDLLDVARVEDDPERRLALWKELVYKTERLPDTVNYCANASRELATYMFYTGAFAEAAKALETTYPPDQLIIQLVAHAQTPLANLTAQAETKATGEKVAEQAVQYLREKMPTELSDDAQKATARQHWYAIADIEAAARRLEKVTAAYDQMTKTFGADDEILGRYGAWLRTQNRRDEARQVYARFKDPVKAAENTAITLREEQKYDEAIGVYQRLAAMDPKQAVQWQSLVAYTYREARKPDEAIAAYQPLLTQDTAQANRWQWEIACTYRDFGKLKEAVGAFRLCENFPDSYVQMAWCHRGLGEFKEALSLYGQIIGGHEPTAPWALLQIGYTYEQSGEKENAIKSFQQVCKKFPKSGQASEAHAHLNDAYKITVTLGGAVEE